jgi:hypothetical protein
LKKRKQKYIADFHVLELFMAEKHDLSEKKIRLSRAVVRRNLFHAYSLPLNARKLKFWLSFRPTLCASYSEF